MYQFSTCIFMYKTTKFENKFPIEITIYIFPLITLILWTSSATTASHSTELSSSYKQSVTLHFEIKLGYQKKKKNNSPSGIPYKQREW